MKKVESKMLRAMLIGLFGAGAVAAHAGYVAETGTELITTADLNGDSRQDVVVVDKASGTFRAAYQLAPDTFTWSDSRSLGATNITGVTTGPMLDTSYDAIAATTPLLNKVNVLAATTPTNPVYPIPAFGLKIGPHSPVAVEINHTPTPEMDLVVSSQLNSNTTGGGLELFESTGTAITRTLSYSSNFMNRGNRVEYETGKTGSAFMDRTSNIFRIYKFDTGSLSQVAFRTLTGLTSPDYCPIMPPGGFIHIFVWTPGTTNVMRSALSYSGSYSFSALTPVPFNRAVESIHTVRANGTDWLVVLYSKGDAEVFSYNGSGNPVLHQSLPSAPFGKWYSAVVPSANDRFTLLTAGLSSGQTESAEVFEYSGGTFNGLGAASLPPVLPNRGRGNVMTFRNEPFVNPVPQRLQTYNARDWTREVTLLAGPARISAVHELDRGTVDGLGDPDSTVIGAAHADANYTLANQAGTTFSVFNIGMAVGEQGTEAFIAPAPGHYRTGISVSFTNHTGGTVYYRESTATAWSTYSASFPLYKDTTILYYARDGSEQSPIYTAAYTFEQSPNDLDSDGDGIPDYVEIAYGLDPLYSGTDGDGDGFQDIEELIDGTDPTNSAAFPAGSRLEQLTAFDLHLTPRPYDGTANTLTLCRTGTALRAYSGAGWQYAYATATNHGVGGVTDPSIKLEDIPSTLEPNMFTVLTDQHFPISTAFSNKNIGIEMAGALVPPTFSAIEINAPAYTGTSLSTDASNWVAAAISAFSTAATEVVTGELNSDNTLIAMMVERKLADELFARGVYTNRTITLFPNRPADSTLQGMTKAELVSLQSPTNTHPAFLPSTIIAEVAAFVSSTNSDLLTQMTEDLYDVCSELSDASPGAYPLPMTVLREFLLSGNMHSNYAAQISLTSNQLATAYSDAVSLLASAPIRPIQSFDLEVRAGSFSNACPVLYTVGGQGKSLYDEGGRPYIMPFSFDLGIGAELTAEAYTDVAWNRCPGTDPIEVISLTLTAVPVSSDTDVNGNLLPDALEANLLGGGGNPAHLDSDGDGFSDLQEYLEGTDLSDPYDIPSVPAEDLSPPQITITPAAADTMQVSVEWPAHYASPFVFTVIYSDNLASPGYATEHEIPSGLLSTTISTGSSDARFYKVGISLR